MVVFPGQFSILPPLHHGPEAGQHSTASPAARQLDCHLGGSEHLIQKFALGEEDRVEG